MYVSKIVNYFFILTAVILLLSSCEHAGVGDCLSSTGDIVSIERQLPDFDTIETTDHFEVYLVQDTVYKVVIEGGANLLDQVETVVEDNKLIISDYNICNFLRQYGVFKIFVHFPKIYAVNIFGASDFYTADTLYIDTLFVFAKGDVATADLQIVTDVTSIKVWDFSGIFNLSGRCRSVYYNPAGGSTIKALEFKANNVYILQESFNDVYVNVLRYLKVTFINRGSVYYKGDPYAVVREDSVNSSGQIIKIYDD